MRENRKTLVGRVISDKMDKTVVVLVESRKRHRLYHRIITRTKKFKAHDETKRCGVGDLVRIIESRPMSKEKRWRFMEFVERAR